MGLNLLDIGVWWLVLEIIGVTALPISFYLCRNLKDRGYCASKPLGLLLFTYITWIISIVIGYSYISAIISIFLIAAFSLWVYIKKGITFDKKYIIEFELIFLLAFLFFALIRSYSPDIYWTGGEKFMDMTFINGLLRTTEFPPFDPWMSGNTIYYYYFGYLVVSNLIIISGITPSIAFNLATASFFALSFATAFGIGFNLANKSKYGFVTAFFVVIAGNFVGFFQLMDILTRENVVDNLLSFNYWPGSRVIPGTINEFPYFSFLHGDLHPHMISIAFQLLVILLLLNIMKSDGIGWGTVLMTGLSIGFLYPLNTWDYPVYLAMAILVTISICMMTKKQLKESFLLVTGMTAASYLFYLPYHMSYRIGRTISLVTSGRTSLIFYMAIYGLFLFFIYIFILKTINNNYINNKYIKILKFSWIFPAMAVLITIFEFRSFINGTLNPKITEFELLVLLVPLLFLSIFSLFKEKDRNNVFVLILIISGTIISLLCEFFYIQDALGSGNPAYVRLNTVFKLYLQKWILWGVSAGYIVYLFRSYFFSNKAYGAAAVILILVVSIYPVFATIGKSGGFESTPELDGEAYVIKEHPQEYPAILWFRNITGHPVVLQAPGELYQWNTVITTFTGLPTVIGWAGHELNWRYPENSEINMRWSDAGRMYTSGDIREVEKLLIKYNVSYVYFGDAESKRYVDPELFEKNPDNFKKVFEYGDTRVFRFVQK